MDQSIDRRPKSPDYWDQFEDQLIESVHAGGVILPEEQFAKPGDIVVPDHFPNLGGYDYIELQVLFDVLVRWNKRHDSNAKWKVLWHRESFNALKDRLKIESEFRHHGRSPNEFRLRNIIKLLKQAEIRGVFQLLPEHVCNFDFSSCFNAVQTASAHQSTMIVVYPEGWKVEDSLLSKHWKERKDHLRQHRIVYMPYDTLWNDIVVERRLHWACREHRKRKRVPETDEASRVTPASKSVKN